MNDPDELELNADAQAWLSACREHERGAGALPPQTRARVWAQLASATAPPQRRRALPNSRKNWAWGVGTFAALAAAALLFVNIPWARLADQRADDEAQLMSTQPATAPPTRHGQRKTREPRADPVPRPAAEPEVPLETLPDAPDVEIPLQPRAPIRAKPRPARHDRPPSLAEDAALLRRAQAAMQTGDTETALRLLATSAVRAPQSPLAEERDALRIVAICTAGHSKEGRVLAREFAERHHNSPLATRIRRACSPHSGQGNGRASKKTAQKSLAP